MEGKVAIPSIYSGQRHRKRSVLRGHERGYKNGHRGDEGAATVDTFICTAFCYRHSLLTKTFATTFTCILVLLSYKMYDEIRSSSYSTWSQYITLLAPPLRNIPRLHTDSTPPSTSLMTSEFHTFSLMNASTRKCDTGIR